MRITLLAALLATVLGSSLLCGCGQKGPLFIPTNSPSNPAAPSQPSK